MLLVQDGSKIWDADECQEYHHLFLVSIRTTCFCWDCERDSKHGQKSEVAVTVSATGCYHWNIDLHMGKWRLSQAKQEESERLWKWRMKFDADLLTSTVKKIFSWSLLICARNVDNVTPINQPKIDTLIWESFVFSLNWCLWILAGNFFLCNCSFLVANWNINGLAKCNILLILMAECN